MTRSFRLLAFLFFGFSLQTMASEPAFIVFYNSGMAVKIVGTKSVLLKKGDHLQSTDLVSVPAKTQLVLVCSNFTVLQLASKSKQTIKSLMAKCNQKEASASSAYFKYVWNSFAHEHISPENEPRKYMKTYGAASRGKGSLVTNLSVDTINYYSGLLRVSWMPAKATVTEFYKEPVGGEAILISKNSTSLKIDSIATKLKAGNYYWDMQGQQSAKRKYLKIWTKEAYRSTVATILKSIVNAPPAEKAYLTAFIFEEKHYLAEAFLYYKKALSLAPNNQIYKEAVTRF